MDTLCVPLAGDLSDMIAQHPSANGLTDYSFSVFRYEYVQPLPVSRFDDTTGEHHDVPLDPLEHIVEDHVSLSKYQADPDTGFHRVFLRVTQRSTPGAQNVADVDHGRRRLL